MADSTAVMTNVGFDWGDMAVERCFEHKGMRCVRIRSISTGLYVDVELSPKGRHITATQANQDDRLKGFDPCGGKEAFTEIFKVSAGPLNQVKEKEENGY